NGGWVRPAVRGGAVTVSGMDGATAHRVAGPSRSAIPGGNFHARSAFDSGGTVSDWQVWIVGAALLLVAEMFAPGFWLASVAIGCLAAGIAGLLPIGILGQTLVFAVTTVGSLFGLRPVLVRRFLHARGMEVRTNVEALVGKSGLVTKRFDPVTRL